MSNTIGFAGVWRFGGALPKGDRKARTRANLLGKPGDGLKILLASLNRSRPSIAAHALGIARAAFEDAVGYINERRQSGRKIIEFQGIQFMLADMATDLAMCEAWLWHVARMVDGGAAARLWETCEALGS